MNAQAPGEQVSAGIGDKSRPAAGAAGTVERGQLRLINRQHPQRIPGPHVVLRRHGEARQIFQGDLSTRGDTGGFEPLALHPANVDQPVDQPAQPILLDSGPLLGRHRFRLRLEHVPHLSRPYVGGRPRQQIKVQNP